VGPAIRTLQPLAQLTMVKQSVCTSPVALWAYDVLRRENAKCVRIIAVRTASTDGTHYVAGFVVLQTVCASANATELLSAMGLEKPRRRETIPTFLTGVFLADIR
jgi:hypothetical protein